MATVSSSSQTTSVDSYLNQVSEIIQEKNLQAVSGLGIDSIHEDISRRAEKIAALHFDATFRNLIERRALLEDLVKRLKERIIPFLQEEHFLATKDIAKIYAQIQRAYEKETKKCSDALQTVSFADSERKSLGAPYASAMYLGAAIELSKAASTFRSLGLYPQALELCRRILQMRQQVQGREDTFRGDIVAVLGNMGCILDDMGLHVEAKGYIEEVYMFYLNEYKDNHPSIAQAVQNLAVNSRNRGFYRTALQYHNQAREMFSRLGKTEKISQYEYGECLLALGKIKQALAVFDEGMLKEKFDGTLALFLQRIAVCHYYLGNYKEALRELFNALQQQQRLYGPESLYVGITLIYLSNVLAAQGEFEQAIAQQKKAIAILKKFYTEKHPYIATAYNNLGSYYSYTQDIEKAKDMFRAAFAMRRHIFGYDHPDAQLSKTCLDLLDVSHKKVHKEEDKRLTDEDLSKLIQHVKQYLNHTKLEALVFKSNPTGFVRLQIPSPEFAKEKRVTAIRLNYWPLADFVMNKKIEIVEALHDHPQYFESKILQGGYQHLIYRHVETGGEPLRMHRIVKRTLEDPAARNIFHVGMIQLQKVETVSVKEGSHVNFPRSLIHQVLSAEAGTLTMNCVFGEETDLDYFNVYMPSDTYQEPKVARPEIDVEDAKKVLQEMKEAFSKLKR